MEAGSLLVSGAVIAASYLIGGIPWGIIIAKVVGGPDPRSLGSGRTGGANVMRVLGPRVALTVGLLDAAKGVASVLLAVLLGTSPIVQALAGLAAILGHSRSPFIGFEGGRGVATGWGALLVIQPVIALVAVPIFAGIVLATRISSLASLATTAACAVGLIAAVVIVPMAFGYLVFAIGAAAMIWLFHTDNIRRLLAGQERRIDGGQPPP